MSGGSLDYLCLKVEEAASHIRSRHDDALHLAFADHLEKVAKALHGCEWVMSYDLSPGDDEEAIRAVLHEGAELESAAELAIRAIEQLERVAEHRRFLEELRDSAPQSSEQNQQVASEGGEDACPCNRRWCPECNPYDEGF